MTHFLKHSLIALFSLVLGTFLFNTDSVFAEGAAMKLAPVVNAVYIKAGDVQNYQFSLENTGPNAFSFKLYTTPYNVINEDYDVELTQETQYSQITRWISFQDDSGSFVKEPTFTLEPGEIRTIVYRISVPDDIPDGGQYCTITAETISDGKIDVEVNGVGLSSTNRVSLIILGHGSGETKGTAEITDFSLTGMFSSHEIDATAKVKNTGNTDFAAVYDLTVKTIFGRVIYTSSDNYAILPNSERRFSTSWAEAPLFGMFTVSYKVSALDASREDSHVIFIMPAFVIVITLLLLTSIIVWTIILLRKRKERSSRLVV